MGERKGVNKYYPPDWDPSKGSINQYVGQHPLRDRARKLGQGILIIRFEMPYNIWCGGCNSHIGMGVRYNAEKTKTGMYYTTPIYKFRMKCHLCDNHFEIQTDPKNHDYVVLEGARRKEQRWDPKENEQIVTEDKAVQKKMVTDAMFKLEHGSDDIQKGKKAISNLGSLEVRRDEWKDDYMLNKLARQKFRDEKKAIKAEAESDSALLVKSSLDIPLQKETEEDVKLAGLIKYRALESYDEKQSQKRKEIESRPLFQTSNKIAKIEDNSPENKKLDIIKKHLRNVKTNNQTNPFDRTKMNTLGSTISKQSLGIRRKSLPEIGNLVSKPVKEEEHLCNENGKNHSEEICDNLLHNGSDKSKESEENSEISENSQKDQTYKYLACNSCGKPFSKPEGVRQENTTSASCACENDSKLRTETTCASDISIVPKDGSVSVESEASSNKNTLSASVENIEMKSHSYSSSNQKDFKKSALGLVCSYSDTDSDS
ncbi:coiled-coil domain-containing protein 130 homolog [Mercenaria mercenaria]|uniref:coiled-coil domain-containing protein 130 homolog n=1 Tax=Mercenaria mercenaria TaxID=6596 RepID=UPI00234E8AEF|nr:coiled-coil domain-containing protein 130 homolog [Mercenaria mercenaria]